MRRLIAMIQTPFSSQSVDVSATWHGRRVKSHVPSSRGASSGPLSAAKQGDKAKAKARLEVAGGLEVLLVERRAEVQQLRADEREGGL
jgi:hypothetical protein